MTTKELLMNQVDKEFSKMTDCSNLMILIRKNLMSPRYEYSFKDLLIRQDMLLNRLNYLTTLIMDAPIDTDFISLSVECINTLSFMIMNFTLDVRSYESILKSL